MKRIALWSIALLLLVIAPLHEAMAKTVWHMHLTRISNPALMASLISKA